MSYYDLKKSFIKWLTLSWNHSSNQIEFGFQQTEKFKVKIQQRAILEGHRAVESAFKKEYGQCEYRYCSDVFGTLSNPAYLDELMVKKKV